MGPPHYYSHLGKHINTTHAVISQPALSLMIYSLRIAQQGTSLVIYYLIQRDYICRIYQPGTYLPSHL